MRKLIIFTALLGLASGAYAGTAEVSHSGEFRVRHKVDMGGGADFNDDTGSDSEGTTYTRFKLGSTFRAGEKITGHLTLIHAAQMGAFDNAADKGLGDATHDNINQNDLLLVNEAYGSWMASDALMLKVGRFAIEVGDGTVFSANDYEQVPYSFEGLMVGYDTEFAKFGLYAVKHFDEGVAATSKTDVEGNSYLLTFDLKNNPEILKMVHAHVAQTHANSGAVQAAATPAQADVSMMRYGLTVKGETAGVDFRATYNAHTGEANDGGFDVNGNMMEAEVGYTLADVMGLRLYALYHMDSGSDDGQETYQPGFYYKHGNAGLMDVVGWGNLTDMAVGATLKPMDDLEVGLHYHMFAATEEGDANETPTGDPLRGANDDTAIGSEIDLTVDKTYENGFKIGARFSMFTPGDAFANDDAYNQFWLQAGMTF